MNKEDDKSIEIILTSIIAVLIVLIVSVVIVILVRSIGDDYKVEDSSKLEYDTKSIVIEETDGVNL